MAKNDYFDLDHISMQMHGYANTVTPLIPPTLALINTTIKQTLYCNLHFINEAHNLLLVKLRAL